MVSPTYALPGRGPIPDGYKEAQHHRIGKPSNEEAVAITTELLKKALENNPGYLQHKNPVFELDIDAAGVEHFGVYVGIAPKDVAEPPHG